MAENQEALQNPFSREKAYAVFRENLENAARLREEIRQDRETPGTDDRQILLRYAEMLGRLTDNTILADVIRRALEARDGETEAGETK